MKESVKCSQRTQNLGFGHLRGYRLILSYAEIQDHVAKVFVGASQTHLACAGAVVVVYAVTFCLAVAVEGHAVG